LIVVPWKKRNSVVPDGKVPVKETTNVDDPNDAVGVIEPNALVTRNVPLLI
jgi:hypothetical protein